MEVSFQLYAPATLGLGKERLSGIEVQFLRQPVCSGCTQGVNSLSLLYSVIVLSVRDITLYSVGDER